MAQLLGAPGATVQRLRRAPRDAATSPTLLRGGSTAAARPARRRRCAAAGAASARAPPPGGPRPPAASASAAAGAPTLAPLPDTSRPRAPGAMLTWRWRGRHAVAYERTGRGPTPLVLVHGMGACHEQWDKLIDELDLERYTVYALDLLGFGDSDKPPPSELAGPLGHFYDYDLWGAQVLDFVEEVVGEPAVLVGNSAGALAALQASVSAPRLALGLVLLDCTLRRQHERNQPALLHPLVAAFQWALRSTPLGAALVDRVLAAPGALRGILESAYGDPAALSPRLAESFRRHLAEPGSRAVLLDVFTNSTGPLPQDLLPTATAPTVVMWGSRDPWEPVDQAERVFTGFVSQFIVLPGVGHFPQDEVPSLVAAVLDRFVDECALPRGDGGDGGDGGPRVCGFTLRGLMAAAEMDPRI